MLGPRLVTAIVKITFPPTFGVLLFTDFRSSRSIRGTGVTTASSSSSSYGNPFSLPGVESGSKTPATCTWATFVMALPPTTVAVISRFVDPPTAKLPMVHKPVPDT